MAAGGIIAFAMLLVAVGVSTLAVSPSSPDNNKVSVEDDSSSLESRNDHPDLDDLSSFFDFELAPPNRNYQDPSQKSTRHKYYYYYRPGGPMYPEHQYVPPQKQVVTPGSHYKDQDSNDTKSNSKKAVIGSYQVSVVDADSPVLSDLGLSKDDLEKLSSYTRRSSNGSLLGSDSVQTATYAEHPRQDYPHSNAPGNHYEPNQYGTGGQYRPSESGTGGQYRPSEYYPADGPPPQRGYGYHPPPQGSYDAKSYERVQSSSSSGYAPPQHSHHHHHYPPPASSYPPKRSSGEPWRATSHSHTDWDDKHGKKQEGYQPHGSYHSPPSHSSAQTTSSHHHPPAYHPRPTYTSTDKPAYRYPTYKHPTSQQKPTYSGSSSSEYHSHKSSSSHYPPSSHHPKAPSRAGSYPHEGEASKPGITIRFKAKAPGGGLSIPVNFNPLDVVKKLIPLSALNPLNNKKVTIGITIENKKEGEHHAY